MARAKQLERLLEDTLERRREELLRVVLPGGKGRPKTLSRRMRDRRASELVQLAEEILVRRLGKRAFAARVYRRHLKHVRGGDEKRFWQLYDWASRTMRRPIVYSFWQDHTSLYVGKGASYRRLKNYRRTTLLRDADSVEIWEIRTRRLLPSSECLAIHYFVPLHNEYKAARRKWTSKCPVCEKKRDFKQQLKSLLRLKG